MLATWRARGGGVGGLSRGQALESMG